MNETKGFNITLGGAPRRVWLNFRAMRRLGMKGPSDAAALQSRIDTSLGEEGTFENTAKLIHDILVESERREHTPMQVEEWLLDEWDVGSVVAFLDKIRASAADGEQQSNGEAGIPLALAPPAPV